MKRVSVYFFTSKDLIPRPLLASRYFKCLVLGVVAEFERGIIRERVNVGLARARANGTRLGRRRVEPDVEQRILELRAMGDGDDLKASTRKPDASGEWPFALRRHRGAGRIR